MYTTPTLIAAAALKALNVATDTTDERDLYSRWTAVLDNLNNGGTTQLLVKPAESSLFDSASLKPDLVAYTKDAPRTAFYLELAGDLKIKSAPFLAKHYLQIERYAHVQLSQQPRRPFFYCFLANANTIEFFKFERSDSNSGRLKYMRSPTMALSGEGGTLLLQLLCAPPDQRGTHNPPLLTLPVGGRLVFEKQLGAGASATAFQCSIATGSKVVVKWFKFLAPLQCEVHYLKLLKDRLAADQYIPTLLHFDEKLLLVVISPLATKLSLSSPSCDLLRNGIWFLSL